MQFGYPNLSQRKIGSIIDVWFWYLMDNESLCCIPAATNESISLEVLYSWLEEPEPSLKEDLQQIVIPLSKMKQIAERAKKLGAEQELKSCVEWLAIRDYHNLAFELSTERSLTEQQIALRVLDSLTGSLKAKNFLKRVISSEPYN